MLTRDNTAVYSLLTDGKRRKLQTERSSLESIHQLRVSTKRVSIGVTNYRFSTQLFKKRSGVSLDDRSHSSLVASSTRLRLSMLNAYG